MNKKLTVTEVLKRGQIRINVPVVLIIFVGTLGTPLYSALFLPENLIIWASLAGLILGFGLAWAWWSYEIVKWRIWAYENTKKTDWNSLKQRAISQKLIWPDGSIFEKTEFRSWEEQQKINKFNKEIEHQIRNRKEEDFSLNKIKDDPSLPSKIEYSHLKFDLIATLVYALIMISFGIYLITTNDFLLGIIIGGMGLFIFDWKKTKKIWSKDFDFSIGNEGIFIKEFEQLGLINWSNTQDVCVDTENGILELKIWEEDECYDLTYSLKDYGIKDFDVFLDNINVFLKRNYEKMNNQWD